MQSYHSRDVTGALWDGAMCSGHPNLTACIALLSTWFQILRCGQSWGARQPQILQQERGDTEREPKGRRIRRRKEKRKVRMARGGGGKEGGREERSQGGAVCDGHGDPGQRPQDAAGCLVGTAGSEAASLPASTSRTVPLIGYTTQKAIFGGKI